MADAPSHSRRALLGASAVALAGCLGDGADDTEPDEENTSFDPDDIETRARGFVELLAAGQFDTAARRVDPAAVDEVSAGTLETAWQRHASPSADRLEVVTAEFEQAADGRAGVTVAVRFDERVVKVGLTYGGDGVTGVSVAAAEWTAPGYVDGSAFTESELTLDAPGVCSLGATLTLPVEADSADGQVPGAVIVHGSGPLDRDGRVGPNRTYRELAEGLATEGVAVLRYDKRTLACPVDLADVTVDDVTTDDALTAVARLRAHDRVGEVFILGHSIGGLLAPRIAHRDGDLAGLAMLAPGPTRPMGEAIRAQQAHLLSMRDLTGAEFDAAMDAVAADAEQIATLDIGDDEIIQGLGGREYYETLAAYDHATAAATLDVPVRILQGTQDWQVTAEDLDRWRDALAGEPHVEVSVYDGLNHRFQHSQGAMTRTEYFEPASPVACRVIDDIVAFVHAHG